MEGVPHQEIPIQKSAPSFEHVRDALKMYGIDDPATKEIVTSWTIAQEMEVDAAPSPEERSRRMVQFEILRAQLYIEMGDRDGAIQTLRDAWEISARESILDLLDEIETRMNNLT